MGLFDKISKAVGDVTKAVEDSGLIEATKEAAQSIQDSGVIDDVVDAAKEAGEAGKTAYHEKRAPGNGVPDGIADPAQLITVADINEITGLGFDHAYPYRDEEWIGTTLTFETRENRGYFELRVAKAPDGEVYVADDMWEL